MSCSYNCNKPAGFRCFCLADPVLICQDHITSHINEVLINHQILPLRGKLSQNLSDYLNNCIAEKISKLEETRVFFHSAVNRIKKALKKTADIYDSLLLNQIKSCNEASNRLQNDFDIREKSEFVRNFDQYWKAKEPSQDIKNFLKTFLFDFQELCLKFQVTKELYQNGRSSRNFLQISQNLSIDLDFNNPDSYPGPKTKNLMFNTTEIITKVSEVIEIDKNMNLRKMFKYQAESPGTSLKVKLRSAEIRPSKSYTFSVYVKYSEVLSDQMSFSCEILNPGNFNRKIEKTEITKTYPDWYRISQTFTTSSSFSLSRLKVSFGLLSRRPNLLIQGFFLFCDFQLEESSQLTPFCKDTRNFSLFNLVDSRSIPISHLSYNGSEVFFDGLVDSVTCNSLINFGNFTILAIGSWENIENSGICALGNSVYEDPKIKVKCSKQGVHVSLKQDSNNEEFTAFRQLESRRIYCIALASRNSILNVFLDGHKIGQFQVVSSFQYFTVVGVFRDSFGIVGPCVKPKIFQVFVNCLEEKEINDHYSRVAELADKWG